MLLIKLLMSLMVLDHAITGPRLAVLDRRLRSNTAVPSPRANTADLGPVTDPRLNYLINNIIVQAPALAGTLDLFFICFLNTG